MFVKLDCNIVFKSIWSEDSDTKVVWITMLAMADSDGVLEAAVTGIASVAKVSVEKVQIAIDKFLAPDKLSTNPDNDGRKIERTREGYKILNYEIYRQKDHTAAARMRKHRETLRVTGVTLRPVYVSDSLIVLSYLNSKTGKKYRNTKEILSRLAQGHTVDEFKKIIDTKSVDPFFVENPQHMNPVTLFRKSHFDNYLNQNPEDFKKKCGNQIGAYRQEPEDVDLVAKFMDKFPEELEPLRKEFEEATIGEPCFWKIFCEKLVELFKDDESLNSKTVWFLKNLDAKLRTPEIESKYRLNYLLSKYGIPEVDNG